MSGVEPGDLAGAERLLWAAFQAVAARCPGALRSQCRSSAWPAGRQIAHLTLTLGEVAESGEPGVGRHQGAVRGHDEHR
jgi:hypothetical protein